MGAIFPLPSSLGPPCPVLQVPLAQFCGSPLPSSPLPLCPVLHFLLAQSSTSSLPSLILPSAQFSTSLCSVLNFPQPSSVYLFKNSHLLSATILYFPLCSYFPKSILSTSLSPVYCSPLAGLIIYSAQLFALCFFS